MKAVHCIQCRALVTPQRKGWVLELEGRLYVLCPDCARQVQCARCEGPGGANAVPMAIAVDAVPTVVFLCPACHPLDLAGEAAVTARVAARVAADGCFVPFFRRGDA